MKLKTQSIEYLAISLGRSAEQLPRRREPHPGHAASRPHRGHVGRHGQGSAIIMIMIIMIMIMTMIMIMIDITMITVVTLIMMIMITLSTIYD